MKGAGRHWVIATFALTLLISGSSRTLGDGMVFPRHAFAVPTIPDQEALLYFANGTETLVIQTSFVGLGTNFAWVVPLPAVPKIEAVSTGLFPTLRTIFQPEVVLSVGHYWLILPAAALLIWLVIFIRRSADRALIVALILLPLLLILPAFLPGISRAKAGDAGAPAANVIVLQRDTIGLFDTVTLRATNATDLVNWLKDHGFEAPQGMVSAAAEYVNDGWVFAAARLHCEPGAPVTRATHPLAFTFKTPKPVYPLRLTATATDSCRIDLYVFGPRRAHASGFEVQRCEAPLYHLPAQPPRLHAGRLQIRNPELAELTAHAPVATKLSGVLDSAAMTHDVYVRWGLFRPSGTKIYSTGAALTLSADVASLVFAALVLVWWTLSRTLPGFRAKLWGRWLAHVALTVGLLIYAFVLPSITTPIHRGRVSRSLIKGDCMTLALAAAAQMQDANLLPMGTNSVPQPTKKDLDRALQATIRSHPDVYSGHELRNVFTGQPLKCEASPGNVILRAEIGQHVSNYSWHPDPAGTCLGYELVWYDLDGAEAIIAPLVAW